MYIITQKLFEKYPSKKEFIKIFSTSLYTSILKGNLPDIYRIISKISLSDINYTYSDFIQDYSETFQNYREKEFLYKIFSKGHSLKSFALKYSINEKTLQKALKSSVQDYRDFLTLTTTFFFESEAEKLKIDLKKFQIIKYDRYLKIIGSETDLKIFREKYNLKFDITERNGLKMLVFDGFIYNLIKLNHP